MGCFDSFYCWAECPYCGCEDSFEFQTKEFGCYLIDWFQGHAFSSKKMSMIVRSGSGCTSEKCNAWQVKRYGYQSGFGRGFLADVVIIDGIVAGVINIQKKHHLEITDKLYGIEHRQSRWEIVK